MKDSMAVFDHMIEYSNKLIQFKKKKTFCNQSLNTNHQISSKFHSNILNIFKVIIMIEMLKSLYYINLISNQ